MLSLPKRVALLSFAFALIANAKLLRIDVTERSDVLDGASFGQTGPYERVVGKAYFGVDPTLPANRIIVDIDLAPKNAEGLVEFSSDIYLLKPKDVAKGNRSVLFEVSNRGGKGALGMYNRGSGGSDPKTAAQFGDKLLMEQGYTIAWLGWQFDVPKTPGLLRLNAPIATDGRKTITGLVRAEFVPDSRTTVMPLADRGHIPYPVVEIKELTVRENATGPRTVVARGNWNLRNGTEIYMERGFVPGKFYELVYTAKDPVVVGLGPAAIRDLISFLKDNGGNTGTALSEASSQFKYAYGFGISQSGRFLRKYLFDGFNADEKGRKVFDGLLVHVGGAGRGSFNHRFAQPSRDGHPYLNVLYPTDLFPFTDLPETDPATGVTGGLLDRAAKANTVPKIFYTNSSYEYWGRAASLIHIAPDGKSDAPIADTTRIYMFAGGQHGPAPTPRRNGTVNLSNPNDYRWSMRALLVAMDEWVKSGTLPPESVYPKVAQNELTTPAGVKFPEIPGQKVPQLPKMAWRFDFGPDFISKGIVTQDPPEIGKSFPVEVPQVDADGIDLGGIRMPEVAVPLATYTGWNLRDASIGAPDQLFSMTGSMIPFPQKETAGDSRVPVTQRYTNRNQYLAKVRAAAKDLVSKRLLLDRDVDALVQKSSLEWEAMAK